MKISYADKPKHLAAIGDGSISPDKVVGRLFFSARNLAIEAMLLRIEGLLLREGYPARCEWKESSFGAPVVYIRMLNPKPSEDSWEYGSCSLTLARDSVRVPDYVSGCVYSVAHFSQSEHWRGRQPAKLVAFRERVAQLYEDGYLVAEIEKLNYPFDYESHSSF